MKSPYQDSQYFSWIEQVQCFEEKVSCSRSQNIADGEIQIPNVLATSQLYQPIMQYTHMRNRNSNTQGSLPNVVSDFPYLKELPLKERVCFLWEQILSLNKFPFWKRT